MAFRPVILAAIRAKASAHRIAPELLAAFVMTESSGNPAATRYEPATLRYVDQAEVPRVAMVAGVSQADEIQAQMTSWGLLQLMGFNARLLGYKGKLRDLTDPELGLEMGACWLKHLQVMFAVPLADGGVLDYDPGLACAYNAGHPKRNPDGTWVVQAYVDKVAGYYRGFKAKGL